MWILSVAVVIKIAHLGILPVILYGGIALSVFVHDHISHWSFTSLLGVCWKPYHGETLRFLRLKGRSVQFSPCNCMAYNRIRF